MIRKATPQDVTALMGMGERFFKASGYCDVTEYDPRSFEGTLLHAISDPSMVVLVIDRGGIVGMAGAILYPFYFNATHLTAQEMFWWVDEEHRGGIGKQLFIELMNEIRARGAHSLSMIALETMNPETVGEIYRKMGFRQSEHSYIKRL